MLKGLCDKLKMFRKNLTLRQILLSSSVMDFEEYTENTNTGILFPPKDHSFENLKAFAKNSLRMITKGPLFFLLVSFVTLWGILLGMQNWIPTYQGQFLLHIETATDLTMPPTVWTDWQNRLLNNPKIKQALKNEAQLLSAQTQNPFLKAQLTLQSFINPVAKISSPLTQDTIQARLRQAIRVNALSKTSYEVNLQDANLMLLGTLWSELPQALQPHLDSLPSNQKALVTVQDLQSQPFSLDHFLQTKNRTFNIAMFFGLLMSLFATYKWVQNLARLEEQELRMTFPFSVLGLLPKLDDQTSPTVVNDAFELLRTNISMQRSVFSFSSLTLIWPFDKQGQNEFLTRLASDFGKTNKKVLVIETAPNTLSKHYACENHKGLTDLHNLIKTSVPQSNNENAVFWKMYEYVFGTEEKFYCMPYGQAVVAENLLFEKYNFRRILNVLKKHFSLLILNVPSHIDYTNTLAWTTVNDATLLVANYQNNASVADKDHLKSIACSQRFLLGGILLDVPMESQGQQILKYDKPVAAKAS